MIPGTVQSGTFDGLTSTKEVNIELDRGLSDFERALITIQ